MPTTTEVEIPSFKEAFEQTNIVDARIWEKHLVFGQYPIQVVLKEVRNGRWQRERVRMLRTTLEFKWNVLSSYLRTNNFSEHSKIVVTNYVYAIKRGGIIK